MTNLNNAHFNPACIYRMIPLKPYKGSPTLQYYQAFWRLLVMLSIVISLSQLTACASTKDKSVVKPQSQQTVENVYFGTVSEVNEVMLAGRVTPVGSTTAGVLGRVAGASAGGTSGAAVQILATLGGMVGGILGSSAEEAMTRKPGLEIYVVLDASAEMVRVIQTAETTFSKGDRVKVIENGSKSRVEAL